MGLLKTAGQLAKDNAPVAPEVDNKVKVEGEGAPVGAPAGVPVGAGVPAGEGAKDSKDKTDFQAFKQTGISARESMKPEEKQLECSKSNTVKFITALGNPKKSVKRVEGGSRYPSHEVVGYTFEALEDMEIPTCKLKPGFKSAMDVEEPVWTKVKKGEKFDLTCYETGKLISQVQYGGVFNGGGDEVILHVTISKSNGGVPNTVLKRREGALKSQLVLVGDKQELGNGKASYKVKPEFEEKFGYLFTKAQTTHGANNNSRTGEAPKDLAAALRLYYSKAK